MVLRFRFLCGRVASVGGARFCLRSVLCVVWYMLARFTWVFLVLSLVG